MEIRKLTPDEHRAADVLESLSFLIPLADEKKEEKEDDAYQPDRWGYFDDQNRLTATLTNHNLPFYLGGGIAAARGVAGVASDPVSRGSGHVRALFKHVLRDDRLNGMLFSALYPFSHSFYGKFGYEICYEHRKARFPTSTLEIYRTGDPPQARLLCPKDGTAALRPIYETFARRYTFMVARDEHSWNRLRIADPLKAEKYCYILSRGGMDIAYAVFSYRPGEKPYIRTLCLTDFAFVHHKAFADLMGFLYRYTAQAQTTEILLPEDLPVTTLLQESYKVEYASGTWPMARALHVENILKVMRHPAEDGVYTIDVEDAFLPENGGGYRVRYAKDGAVTVSRFSGAADMRLSVQTFAQLALGYLGLRDAAFKPDVSIEGNRATLEKVFERKVKFLLDFY